MFIDFFTYTDATAGGTLTIDELLQAAEDAGLDGLVIADKNSSANADEIMEAAENYDLFVAVGVEIDAEVGRFLCIPSKVDGFLLEEEWRSLTSFGLPSGKEIVEAVAKADGVAIARGVYDKGMTLGDGVFRLKGLAGIDVITPTRKRVHNEFALEASVALGVCGVAGSDALEDADNIGKVATMISGDLETQEDLVTALRNHKAWAVALGKPIEAAPRGGDGNRRDDRGGRGGDRGRGRDKGGRGRGRGDRDNRGGRGGRDGGGRDGGRDNGRGRRQRRDNRSQRSDG